LQSLAGAASGMQGPSTGAAKTRKCPSQIWEE
jgi:hypothetical protein